MNMSSLHPSLRWIPFLSLLVWLNSCQNGAPNFQETRVDTVDIHMEKIEPSADAAHPSPPVRVQFQRKVAMVRVVKNGRPRPGISPEEINIAKDSIRVLRDSVIKTESSVNAFVDSAKEAILGYSYFKKMQQGNSKDINVFVSIKFPASTLIDTLKKINIPETGEFKNDTPSIATSMFPNNISDCDSVDVTLTDPERSFNIDTLGSTRQPVAELSRWTWAVTPVTDNKSAKLILNAVPIRKDHSTRNINPEVIIITVEIVPSFFRKLWIFINNNPWTIITVIIIPLIAFFGKRLFGSKNQKKPK